LGESARANQEDASMSDFERNVAAYPGAARTVAVDAGLRAHMIRVYNYMAGGVALTGLVAYFTHQLLGPTLYNSPIMWVLIFAPHRSRSSSRSTPAPRSRACSSSRRRHSVA
jgi:FtsH-binding integral membrane protein